MDGHAALLDLSSQPVQHLEPMLLQTDIRTLVNALLQILAVPGVNQESHGVVPSP